MKISVLTDLNNNIACYRAEIKVLEKELEKIKVMAGLYGPSGASGIDYSREKGASCSIGFAEAVGKMDRLKVKIDFARKAKRELEEAREDLMNVLYNANDTKTKVFYERFINGVTQSEAAKRIGISIRQLQRIEKKLKEENQ